MNIGPRLTEARKLRELSQAQLAKLIGKTGAWVSKAEAGKITDIHASTLFAVCRVLRINLQWLGEGVGPRDAIPSDMAEDLASLSDAQRTAVRAVIQSMKK